MELRYEDKSLIKSFALLTIVYLLLYFGGDLMVTEFARNTLQLQNSKLIKGYNAWCSGTNFRVLTFLLFVVYFFFRNHEFAKKVLYVALVLTVAMLLKDALKYFFGRARPEEFFKSHIYGMQWLETSDPFHSTPSGHSTRAMALAASLAMLCRKKWLQILLLVFGMSQALCRVILLRHYLSDVLFGMWLGFFVALYIHTCMFDRKS